MTTQITEATPSRDIVPSIVRQVFALAGTLALAGSILSINLAKGWIALPIFVGTMMLFTAITGLCPSYSLLIRAPWNRR